MIKIKACPFCGGELEAHKDSSGYYVICPKCTTMFSSNRIAAYFNVFNSEREEIKASVKS